MASAKLDITHMLWEPRKKELPTQIDCTGKIFPEVIFEVGVDGWVGVWKQRAGHERNGIIEQAFSGSKIHALNTVLKYPHLSHN